MSAARPSSSQENKIIPSTHRVMKALAYPPKRKNPCQQVSDFYYYVTKKNLLIPAIQKGFGAVAEEHFQHITHISEAKKIGNKTIYFVSGPSEIQQTYLNHKSLQSEETASVQSRLIGNESIVTISTSHPEYRPQRDMVMHTGFAETLIADMHPAMQLHFEEIFNPAKDPSKPAKPEKDLADFASRIALSNIGMLLGFDEQSFSKEDKTDLANITHAIIAKLSNPLTIFWMTLENMLGNHIALDRTLNSLLKKGEAIIRKVINHNRPKVLAALNALEDLKGPSKRKKLIDKDLDTPKIMTLIKLFLIGGSDSTSKLLLFCMLMLGLPQNAAFINKMREELGNLKKPITELSSKELESLPYLNAFILEVLRLYPPFSYMRHTAKKEFKLAHNVKPNVTRKECDERVNDAKRDNSQDTTIRPNDILITSLYDAHRNQELYGKDAEEFNPNRWIEQSETKDEAISDSDQPIKIKFSLRDTISTPNLFSFGNDARSCAGRFVATKMAINTLANFLNSYIDIQHNLTMPFPVTPDFTLHLKKGVTAMGIFRSHAQTIKDTLLEESKLPDGVINNIIIPYTGMKLPA